LFHALLWLWLPLSRWGRHGIHICRPVPNCISVEIMLYVGTYTYAECWRVIRDF
jgi:hypothetical protein